MVGEKGSCLKPLDQITEIIDSMNEIEAATLMVLASVAPQKAERLLEAARKRLEKTNPNYTVTSEEVIEFIGIICADIFDCCPV